MERKRLLEEKRAEIARLAGLPLTEITPSRRDFPMFVATSKEGLAVIPSLRRLDSEHGRAWSRVDIERLARTCDDAEAGAIGVSTAALSGGSIADLRAVSTAVSAPTLRDDLCLDATQLYQSRLFGADAVIVPVAEVGSRLHELVEVAQSMHMAAVMEITGAADLAPAIARSPACIGLNVCGDSGWMDLQATVQLARSIPRAHTVLTLAEPAAVADLRALVGHVDAVVLRNSILDAADPAMLIAEIARWTAI